MYLTLLLSAAALAPALALLLVPRYLIRFPDDPPHRLLLAERAGTVRLDYPSSAVTAAADLSSRTITGLVAPYNVVGNTNRGAVRIAPGALQLAADLRRIKLVDNHQNPPVAVGFAESSQDTPQGLQMTFRVGNTPAGDAALLEASEGLRDAFSVELADVELDASGTVTSAQLSAVAQVAVPAFADARMTSIAAAHQPGPMSQAQPAQPAHQQQPVIHTQPRPAAPPAQPAQPVYAAAPAQLPPQGPSGNTLSGDGQLDDLYAAMHRVMTGQTQPQMEAALADIINTNVYQVVGTDSYVGQLWAGIPYTRRFVPLLRAGRLTSWRVKGWRWGVKPAVGDYAGNKAEIPTNVPTVLPATADAARIAGGHDLDRKFRDFGDTEFIGAYLEAMAESYAKISDAKALAAITASATLGPATAAGGNVVAASIIASDHLENLLDGVQADYVLVNRADRRNLMAVTNNNAAAYAKELGFDWDKMIPTNSIAPGAVYAGVKSAGTFYELPGSPIRVEALDLARGGIDEALFGYWAFLLHDARGIVRTNLTP